MNIISIILICGLGTLVYSNIFHYPFQFDDQVYIVHNFAIRNIQDLPGIWQVYPCRFITFLSFAVNYHFHQFNVLGYHLLNVMVHVFSALLVWWLTLLTLSTPVMKEDKITRHANPIALFAGLIFVAHPIQTEAVTYIWQRTASLAAMFYLASLCFYIKSRICCFPPPGGEGKGGGGYYICALITAVLAMFTKENAITLPFMILFYETSFLKTNRSLNWKGLTPFLLTVLIIPLTILFTASPQEKLPTEHISSMQYFLTQLRVMATYIRLVLLPYHQNLDYDYPISKSLFEIPVLLSLLLLIGVFYSAKRLFSKYRLVSFSIFWFFLTLLPESSFLPFQDVIFEHRLYLPLAGYGMFLASGAYYLLGKNNFRAMLIALTMITICYSMLTYQRNKVWRDEFTIWDDAVQKSPYKSRPYNNRGAAYLSQGHFDQAMADYNKAIGLDPKNAEAYYNRGIIYINHGYITQAINDFNKAIELNPDSAKSYNNRGGIYEKQGHFIDALSDYNKAIAIDPTCAEAYYNRGTIYESQGNLAQALSDYSQAIGINPGYAEAYNNRGNAYEKQGNVEQALSDYDEAIAINPQYAEGHYNRGLIYQKQGDFPQALSDYDGAIELNSGYAEAYNNRGNVYYAQGNFPKALSDYGKAIELNPKNTAAYNNRAASYYQLKEYEKSWADVHKLEKLGYTINPQLINVLNQASGNNTTP